MVKLRRGRISKRTVDNLYVNDKNAVFWEGVGLKGGREHLFGHSGIR